MKNTKKLLLTLCCLAGISFCTAFKVSAAPISVRYYGNTRYETAVQVSKYNFDQSNYVIIASGEGYADALCAAPLAKKYNAPILLTEKDSIKDSVIQEITRLGAKNAFIIGGTGVISQNVETQLTNLGISFTRVAGADRFETSAKVAALIGGANGAVIASGENFPDALSIASIAAAKQMPILLTNSNSIPQPIEDFINNQYINKYYAVGGSGVISDTVVNSLSNCTRLGGKDRYDTNLAVINQFIGDLNLNDAYVATGEDFADALSGSAAAAETGAPILLTDNHYLATQSVIQNNYKSIYNLKVLGGPTVVSDTLVQKIINNQAYAPKTIMGYATYYSSGDTASYDSMQTNYASLDEAATFTFDADQQGVLSHNYNVPTNQISLASSKNIRALAVVTNSFTYDASQSILENATNRQAFVNNTLSVLKTYGYKGVNIDFEDVYAKDRDAFTEMMKEIYNTLHPLGYMVTVSVPAKTSDNITSDWNGAYDYAQIANYSDQIDLMAYDEHYAGGSAGPVASIGWVQSVINYAVSTIPREKIFLGVAAYGYSWPDAGGSAMSTGEDNAYAIAAKYNVPVQWDDTSKCPFIKYTDSNGVARTLWFENEQSLGYKLDLVNSNNLGGIAIWRLGFENSDYWNTIKTKFNR